MPSTCKHTHKKNIFSIEKPFLLIHSLFLMFFMWKIVHIFDGPLSTLFLQQQQYKSTKYLVQKQSRTMSAIYLCTIQLIVSVQISLDIYCSPGSPGKTIIHRESRATIFSFILVHQITILNPIHTECRHKWKREK